MMDIAKIIYLIQTVDKINYWVQIEICCIIKKEYENN